MVTCSMEELEAIWVRYDWSAEFKYIPGSQRERHKSSESEILLMEPHRNEYKQFPRDCDSENILHSTEKHDPRKGKPGEPDRTIHFLEPEYQFLISRSHHQDEMSPLLPA